MQSVTKSSNRDFAAGVRGMRVGAALALLLTMGCSDGADMAGLVGGSALQTAVSTSESSTSADPYALAAYVEVLRGNRQTGTAGQPLGDVLRVRVNNGRGHPMPNTPVTWTVTRGGGTLTPVQTTTDSYGITEVTWKLGSSPGMQYAKAVSGPATGWFEATSVEGSVSRIPATVTTLRADSSRDDRIYVHFTEVDDGMGRPASYTVRYHVSPIGSNWGSATDVTQGSCRSLGGSSIGAVRHCYISGLSKGTTYDVQMVAWRTDQYNARVTSRPSNVVTQTAGGGASTQGSLSISPRSLNLTQGATGQLSVTARDGGGSTLTNVGVSWSSSNSGVASVDGSGRVTARQPGSAVISASAGCCSTDRVTVTVDASGSMTMSLTPSSTSITVGQSIGLSATVRDGNGNTVSRTIQWSTSNGGVATVGSDGVVRGQSTGSASITASTDGASATANITVVSGQTTNSPGRWPNEPSDFTLTVDENFGTRHLTTQPAGRWDWSSLGYSTSSIQLVPGEDGSALRWIYAAGRRAGDSPGRADISSTAKQFNSYYIGVNVRWSQPWASHSSGANKILYWGSMETRESTGWGPTQYYLNRRGNLIDLTLQYSQAAGQTNVPWSETQRVASTRVDDGRWHRVEMRIDGNGAGQSTCRARIWVDGILNVDVGGLTCSNERTRFYGVNLDPVWGGAGEAKPYTDYMEIDHLRVSGR